MMIWGWFRVDFAEHDKLFTKSIFQSAIASIIIGFITYAMLQLFAPIFDLDTFFGVFMQGVLSGSIGIIAGVGTLLLFDNPEIKTALYSMQKKSKNIF